MNGPVFLVLTLALLTSILCFGAVVWMGIAVLGVR